MVSTETEVAASTSHGGSQPSVIDYNHSLFLNPSDVSGVQIISFQLTETFKMKDLGELKFFLGIEFARSDKGILMHQRRYALELLAELGLGAAKPAGAPIDYNLKLTSKQFDDHVKHMKPDNDPPTDQRAYQRLVGKLLYLTMTRPDIAFSVQTLSQFLQSPKKSHMEAAVRVVRYVKNQPGLGVLLSSSSEEKVSAYCDADWASCPQTRRSVTGYFVKLGDSIVSWKSKKQATVSRSSAEAEFRSLAAVVAELVWILGLMKEIGSEVTLPVCVFSDSKSAMQIAANPVYHERTKHIDVDCYFIREKILQGVITTSYISTQEQPADMLTKGLTRVQHNNLNSKLGLCDIFSPS